MPLTKVEHAFCEAYSAIDNVREHTHMMTVDQKDELLDAILTECSDLWRDLLPSWRAEWPLYKKPTQKVVSV